MTNIRMSRSLPYFTMAPLTKLQRLNVCIFFCCLFSPWIVVSKQTTVRQIQRGWQGILDVDQTGVVECWDTSFHSEFLPSSSWILLSWRVYLTVFLYSQIWSLSMYVLAQFNFNRFFSWMATNLGLVAPDSPPSPDWNISMCVPPKQLPSWF